MNAKSTHTSTITEWKKLHSLKDTYIHSLNKAGYDYDPDNAVFAQQDVITLPRFYPEEKSIYNLQVLKEVRNASYFRLPLNFIRTDNGTSKATLVTTNTAVFYTKGGKVKQSSKSPSKTCVLFFDRDEPKDMEFNQKTLDEKIAYYKDNKAIEVFTTCHKEFFGCLPYQIHMSANGFHSVAPLDFWMGMSSQLMTIFKELAADNNTTLKFKESMESFLKGMREKDAMTNEKLEEIGISLKSEKSNQETIHTIIYPLFCEYVDEKMKENGIDIGDGYLDRHCKTIARQFPDIGFANAKPIKGIKDAITPLVSVFKEYTSQRDTIVDPRPTDSYYSEVYITLEGINLDVLLPYKGILNKAIKNSLKSLSDDIKTRSNPADSVFTHQKSDDMLQWIKEEGIKKLESDEFIQFILDRKLDIAYPTWRAIASLLAPFSNPRIENYQDDPAYRLFRRISMVNRYLMKPAYNMDTTWLSAVSSALNEDFYITSYSSLITMEKLAGKNPETINAFINWKNHTNKKSMFTLAISRISQEYSNRFNDSIYDNAGLELFQQMGLVLDNEGKKPLNTELNFEKILELDPIINRAFRVNTFSSVIMVHKGLIDSPVISTSELSIEQQLKLSLDKEYADHEMWKAITPECYLWTSIRSYLNERYSLDRNRESISGPLIMKLLAEAMPNKELFVNPIYEAFSQRHEDWKKAGKPQMLENWLADGLYVNKEENPTYYRRLQIIGKKLVLAHLQRALTPDKGGVTAEYLTITCGQNEGSGKSTLGSVAVSSIFGLVKGLEDDQLIEAVVSPYGGGKKGVNLFQKSDDKREGILVRGCLMANVDEIDQYLLGNKDWAAVKGVISASNYTGIPIYGKSVETIPYRFCLYGSSNKRNLLQQQNSSHRRFLVIDLDYENETNSEYYAVGFVEKNNIVKTPKHFPVNSKGNGCDAATDAGKYVIDISKLCKNMALAFGEAFQQMLGQWDDEKLANARKSLLVEKFPKLLPSGKKIGDETVYVEKLALTYDEMQIIGEGNRQYEHSSLVNSSLIIEAVKNYEHRVLTPQILEGQETLKAYPQHQKEKAYASLIAIMTNDGIEIDEHRTLKIEKRKFKVSPIDASTPGSNISSQIGKLISGQYVFVYVSRDATGHMVSSIVGDGCKPFQRLDKKDGFTLSVLDNLK